MTDSAGAEPLTGQEIAVVGMAGRFPGADDVDAFWRNLRAGVDSIARFTREELVAAGVSERQLRDPNYVPAHGMLAEVKLFDAAFFGFSPREASILNPQHRVFLECAWDALERAGYSTDSYAGRIGVYAAGGQNRYLLNVLSQPAVYESIGDFQAMLLNGDSVATMTSYRLNLRGPSINLQTACSSSLVAVHLACQSLLFGESDIVIAGGVHVSVPTKTGYHYSPGGILSPTGECRSFDADARGTVGGSGVGVVVLKRLEDALADGDTVHAVIRGSAVNNDGGEKASYTTPRREGQAEVIVEALSVAGVKPGEVSYVEAHGSATEVGDPIEVAALATAFGDTGRTGHCALGSVKSNIGHLDAAAGIAGLIKTVLALEHGEIPPSLHFEAPNPQIDFARSPFFVNAALRTWERNGRPRRAGVSSFGMGGTNAHIVLEEAPAAGSTGPARPWDLVVLSARTAAALEAATDRLAEHLAAHPEQEFADVAHTLRIGRRRFGYRRILVCRDRRDAMDALAARDPRRVLTAVRDGVERRVAFLFPGFGDQYAGMARGLYEAEPVFRREVDRCAEILRSRLDIDLRPVLFPDEPELDRGAGASPGGAVGETDLRRMIGRDGDPAREAMGRTELAHPALFVVEYALARIWMEWGVRPDLMLGHSLGEYVAATLAGVFELEDVLELVAERARLIAGLEEGAMLAVPLGEARVLALLRGGLALAAVNSAEMCTISGSPEQVAVLEAELAAAGVACRRLSASHAFHSAHMEPVARGLAARVRSMRLREPGIPFVSNVTGRVITTEEATDPDYWARHLCRTVRFAEGMREVLSERQRVLLEVGPGRTLGTFALQEGAAAGSVLATLRHAYTRRSDFAQILETAGQLWLAGVRLDWGSFSGDERRLRVRLPTYPFERQAYWIDPPAAPALIPAPAVAAVSEGAGPPTEEAPAVEVPALHGRPELDVRYVAPEGEAQLRLAAIWEKLLGFGGIGAHDDFFSLGGHSLMATRLFFHVKESFGVDLSLEAVFETPTLAGLAGRIDALREAGDPERLPPILPVPRTGEPLPLSFAQERLWALDQIEPGSPLYNLCTSQWIRGSLDLEVARRALGEIVRRHEVLRTVYRVVDGRPVQVVLPPREVPLPVDDLPDVPEESRPALVRVRFREEAIQPLDLEHGPVMRARMLRFGDDDHVLLLTLHHIVMDGWSWGLMFHEWDRLYAAFAHGEPSPLPELPVQYADYAVWQRRILSGDRLAEHLSYWREALRGVPTVLEVPTDRPHPPVQSYRGGLYGIKIAPDVLEQVRELARREGATIHHVCMAAYQALLFRYTGQEDFVVGSAAANRLRPETQRLLGFFINTLPVRARLAAAMPFGEVLEQVRKAMLGVFAHAEVPLQMILGEVQPERDPSRNPLVQVMFGFQTPPTPDPDSAAGGSTPERSSGLRKTLLPDGGGAPLGDSGTSKFDISILVNDGSAGPATIVVEYNSDLYDLHTVERFADHFHQLLAAGTAEREARLAELAMLRPAERARLLEIASTGPAAAAPTCVHELFSAQAERTPHEVAVVFGNEALSYAELDGGSSRLAHFLRARGVGPETRVAVCLERGPEMVVGVLGVLKAGGAYVPLDPAYPAERLAYTLSDSGASLLVSRGGIVERLPAFTGEVVRLDEVKEQIADEPDVPPRSGVGAGNAAYVIYTSGSTGRPKGVVVEHAGLANTLLSARDTFELAAQEVFASMAGYTFDIWAFEVFAPLLAGGRVRLLPQETARDAERLVEELETVDAVHAVPALMREVVARVQAGPGTLPRMRRVFVGGDAVPPDLIGHMQEAFPSAALWVLYGPTEASILGASSRLRTEGGYGWQVVGSALAGVRLLVCGAGGSLLPAGVPGELWIGGAGVARGYLGRPELTAEKFVPDEFGAEPGARLYRTGDRVRLRPDGELEFLGRVDAQVKIRGFRIEPGEVEAVLLEQEGVHQAAVVVREDADGHKRLVAYVVPRERVEVSTAELRGRLAGRLPEHMVPGAFVTLGSLPLTANGKVDRRALPAPERRDPEAGFVAPRTDVEAILCAVWAGVLKVERVGVEDNFFDLGADSILSIQAVSRARRRGLRLTPRQIFERPTVARLAEVAERVDAGAQRAAQGPVTGEAPLTPIQHRFFGETYPARHHFNQGLLLRPREALDAGVLIRAAAALEAHHDALRLRFRQQADGRWTQSHAEPSPRGPLTVFDLSALPAQARARAVVAAAEQVQRSLDLEHGPLLRMGWFELGSGETGRLLAVAHHLVVDGVSWRVLTEDLESAYSNVSRGGGAALPPKTTSWKAWAERLAELARSDALAEEAGYWSEQAGKKVAPLPVDEPAGENTLGQRRVVGARLTEEETGMLLHQVPAAYRTQVRDVLLTALARALARWTGQRRIRVELEGQGREDETMGGVDVSRTVGWFTAVYPVVLELPGSGGAGAALKAIKEQLRAVPGHGIGYGLLREGGALEPAETPAAEVGFNYLGQFDQSVSADAFFSFAPESAGTSMDPRSPHPHLLEVSGSVRAGRLELRIGYSAAVHRRETIERLAEWCGEEVRALIEHCRSDDVGGYTPSDFPLAGLDQAGLDTLLGSERGVEDVFPLSPLQEGMLFHSLYAPGSGVYVSQFGFVLEGALEEDVLERAWQSAVARHDALRAGFAWEGLPRPVQVVRREARLPFRREDWRGQEAADRRARLEAYLAADRAAGFELGRAPLMRLGLFRTGEEEHHLVWTHHHLVMDGWSLSLIFRDVLAAYMAYARGEMPQPGPARRYREYIAWLQQQDRGRAEAFWKRALAGFDAPTPLPATRGMRGPGEDGGHDAARTVLPAERTRALQEHALEWGVTMSTVLQGAWGLLLGRCAGEADVVFGATTSGRPAALAGVEETVGLFINTLPVRVRLPGDARLRDWLQALQKEQTEAREYEYSPLVDVRRWSDVPAGESLFESLLVFENAPVDQAVGESAGALGDLRVRQSMTREQADIPLVVSAMAAAQLTVEIHYDLLRVGVDDAERIAGYLETLLEAMAADPRQRLAEVSLLRGTERVQVLEAWNDTSRPLPTVAGVPELFAAQAARTPDAVALAWRGGGVTYAELDRRSALLAAALLRRGVGLETRVGVCMARAPELVASLLAVLRAGGAYVPMDPCYPAERLRYMLADSGAALVLADAAAAERLGDIGVEVVRVDGGAEDDARSPQQDESSEGAALSHSRTFAPSHSQLAYVVYTSGSTGTPRGVLGTHRGMVNRFAWMWSEHPFAPDEVCVQKTSLAFVDSVWEVFGPLLAGVPSVLVPDEEARDPEALAGHLAEHGVTRIVLVPSLLRALLDAHPGLGDMCPRLRLVVTSGEELPAELARRFAEALPGATLLNLYGSSEVAADVTRHSLDGADPGAGEAVPIGRPIWNTRVYVADAAMQLLPLGAAGELYVAGAGVARGYVGNPAATAERFVPDPFASVPGGRMYRTGDRARWTAAGELEYLGRADRQVKVRGFRIELGEVEDGLSGLPQVREAAVVVREDKPGDRRLVAYVVPREGAELSAAELRAALAERLPDHMVPAAIVALESLPLTPSGKVDRRALPAPERASALAAYTAPRTPVEEVLAEIWAEVLKTERVSAEDNFFELGGHSLLATQVMSRVRQAFRVEVPLKALFRGPTLAGLAARIEELRSEGTARVLPMMPVERTGSLPLSFAQQRLWVVDRIEPGSAAYNMPFGLRLRGALELPVLRASLDALVRRQESLRTTFSEEDGRPVQLVHPAVRVPLPVVDLAHLPADARQPEARRLAGAEAMRPFDLARGPLLRGTLVRLDAEHHVLLFNMHHIVSDGWSMQVLVREVSASYAAFSRGEEPRLPDLPVQYADFAVWQREWLSGDVLEAEIDFWRERLAGAPPLLEIPTDRPRRVGQDPIAATHHFALPPELSRRLREFSRREGVTLFMTLLAGWQALLGRWAGQDDVVVGTPIAGRTRRETEGLIGFFVNMLVLRARMAADPTWAELLSQVREETLGAYGHQDLPFERLVEELGVERSLTHTPVFQATFTLDLFGGRSGEKLELGQLGLEPFGTAKGAAKFDLDLVFGDGGEGIGGTLVYRRALFQPETMAHMARYMEAVLEGMVADPERPLSGLSLLRSDERVQVLEQWNPPAAGRPAVCVHELFARQAARTPDARAILFGGEVLSYGELDRAANRLAHLLLRRGVGPDVKVGVWMERGPEMVVALLGILKAGGAYACLEADLPAARVELLVTDLAAPLVLTRAPRRDRVPAGVGVLCLDEERERIALEPSAPPAVEVTPEHLCYVIYTSGSTGTPKGTEVPHRAIPGFFREVDYARFDDEQVLLQHSSVSWDALTLELWPALLTGGCCVLYPERSLDPEELQREVERHGVTTLWLTASLFNLVVDTRPETLGRVRQVLTGGEAVSAAHLRRARELYPWLRLVNGYGPSECTVFASCHVVGESVARGEVPIGRPVGDRRLYVLDARSAPVPVGIPGELYVGGAGVARGYLGRPELTAEKFVPDMLGAEPGGRLYRTGDRVRWLPSGELEFLGRVDRQVKIRGFRVEPGEAEAMLAGLPQVREVAVVVREDAPGEKRLVGYVVPREGAELSAAELRTSMGERLPEYLVPSAFVTLESLPLTPNGKVDRRALPRPEITSLERAQAYEAPRDDLEETFTAIFEEVLGVARVGLHDNFFELGGHSLLGVQIMSKLKKANGMRVPVAALFKAPTVELLAREVRSGGGELPLVFPLRYQGSRPPLFLVHPGGGNLMAYAPLVRQLDEDMPVYGLRSRGIEEGEKPNWTIEEMARDYLASIRQVKPTGPYRLGGWSLGGVIAFEMARQLEAAGEEVESLVMIDSQVPALNDPESSMPGNEMRIVQMFAQDLGIPVDSLTTPNLEARDWGEVAYLRGMLETARAAGRLPRDMDMARIQQLYGIFRINLQAMYEYRPESYSGHVILLRATGDRSVADRLFGKKSYGWEQVVQGELGVRRLPGTHYTLLHGPDVENLAREVERAIG